MDPVIIHLQSMLIAFRYISKLKKKRPLELRKSNISSGLRNR